MAGYVLYPKLFSFDNARVETIREAPCYRKISQTLANICTWEL